MTVYEAALVLLLAYPAWRLARVAVSAVLGVRASLAEWREVDEQERRGG